MISNETITNSNTTNEITKINMHLFDKFNGIELIYASLNLGFNELKNFRYFIEKRANY